MLAAQLNWLRLAALCLATLCFTASAKLSWLVGHAATSCHQTCERRGGCSEQGWPTTTRQLQDILKELKVTCRTINSGGNEYDPSIDHKDAGHCGVTSDPDVWDRCGVLAPYGMRRFCPCGAGPSKPQPPAAEPVPRCMPRLPMKHGLHKYDETIDQQLRRYFLFVPSGYNPDQGLPVLIVGPGSGQQPMHALSNGAVMKVAEQEGFAVVCLVGMGNKLNVGLGSFALPHLPDDVRYTEQVMARVRKMICVDPRRVFCVGYSRGARFCVRVASELPWLVAAIATVSGIRYPFKNNATRPVPIIAFHGVRDPLNKYRGGGPPYWGPHQVPDVVHSWARFNGCTLRSVRQNAEHVSHIRYSRCPQNAIVELFRISNGGHTWPGCPASFRYSDWFGIVSQEINATAFIWKFLLEHPLPVFDDPSGHVLLT